MCPLCFLAPACPCGRGAGHASPLATAIVAAARRLRRAGAGPGSSRRPPERACTCRRGWRRATRR
jgi:hypothetical protein